MLERDVIICESKYIQISDQYDDLILNIDNKKYVKFIKDEFMRSIREPVGESIESNTSA
jgi:hypothetical protein